MYAMKLGNVDAVNSKNSKSLVFWRTAKTWNFFEFFRSAKRILYITLSFCLERVFHVTMRNHITSDRALISALKEATPQPSRQTNLDIGMWLFMGLEYPHQATFSAMCFLEQGMQTFMGLEHLHSWSWMLNQEMWSCNLNSIFHLPKNVTASTLWKAAFSILFVFGPNQDVYALPYGTGLCLPLGALHT